jgi:hypothetical protein
MNAVIIRSFANKECHNCGKKGHPARCCTWKKGKTKKGTDDVKLVSSSKSNKTIKSLTKQVKTLKKSVSALQAHNKGSKDNSSISSEEGDAHFQYMCATIVSTNLNVAMALKSPKTWDLDLRVYGSWIVSQRLIYVATRTLNMSSNGSELRIIKEYMVLGYESWMWFTKIAMTNIICLKNIIHLYRVTYNSKQQTAFIVHQEEFGLPNMVFDMHPCGLHVYYPEKIDGKYSFVQTVSDNMKLVIK